MLGLAYCAHVGQGASHEHLGVVGGCCTIVLWKGLRRTFVRDFVQNSWWRPPVSDPSQLSQEKLSFGKCHSQL